MLFKRKKSNNWYFKFTINGKCVYRSTGTSDRKKAQEIADKIKAESYSVIKYGEPQRYLWQEAVDRWLSESEKKSIYSDKFILKWLATYLNDIYIDDITTDTIEIIIKAKLKVAGTTRVNRTTELVRSILNKSLKQWGWIKNVPYIRRFKESNQRLRWLSYDEADKLSLALPKHTRSMMLFSLATGLRESNVTGLEWSQVDLNQKIAWIYADQSKSNKTLRIPLNQDAINILVEQQGKHPRNVFTYRGNPVKKAGTKSWRNTLKKVGIEDFTWHGLRHTWASWHVQNGTPLNVLQELGGWSSYEMVLRYAHLAPNHLSSYANNLEGIVAKSVAPDNLIKLKVV